MAFSTPTPQPSYWSYNNTMTPKPVYSPKPTVSGYSSSQQYQSPSTYNPNAVASSMYGGIKYAPVSSTTPVGTKTYTPSTPQVSVNTSGGFNDEIYRAYYPGWDRTAAEADWKATGGVKAQQASGDPYADEVNSVFGETEGLLNQIEANINAGAGDLYSQTEKQFTSQEPLLKQQYEEAAAGNQELQTAERVREANALTDARRLFGELSQGVRQRFGGATGTGQFASEIMGRELMRNVGNIQSTAGQNVSALKTQLTTIKKDYDAKVVSLKQQMEAALAQARNQIRDQLNQVNSMKVQNAQNKAAAKLDLLNQLRTYTMNLQSQFNSTMQQLAANAVAQGQNVQSQVAAFANAAKAYPSMSGLPTASYSRYGGYAGGQDAGSLISYVSPTQRKLFETQ